MTTYIEVSITLGIEHNEDVDYQDMIDEVLAEMYYDITYDKNGIEIVETRVNGLIEN